MAMTDLVVVRTTGLDVFGRMRRESILTPKDMQKALTEIALWAEDDIKSQHYKGHGRITATLQRSYGIRVESHTRASIETTPASMSANATGPRVGTRVFYAPYVEERYGMVDKTKTRLPKVAEQIYKKFTDGIARRICRK